MRGRYKRKQPDQRDQDSMEPESGLCPQRPGPRRIKQEGGGGNKGSRCSDYSGDRVYLGVRVKMPVKDLLRNIRVAQGCDPPEYQDSEFSKTLKGTKRRVKTRPGRRTVKRKHPTKSLEELAIIVEVLEEDLRTSRTGPPETPPPSASPGSSDWSMESNGSISDDSDEVIPSPRSYVTFSPDTAEDMSPPGFQPPPDEYMVDGGGRGCWDEWLSPQDQDLDQDQDWHLSSSAFFWSQLQREESRLMDVPDAALLATDEHGRTAFHEVACVGKRALGYAMAKRMAALNSLDLRDSDGMTALLHAARHNHHLMVADLIAFGANVNEANAAGKSCLHLSAEKGYVRVLEVLKYSMMHGVYVDLEATDHSGMSVLQCASIALKATVRELDGSKSSDRIRLFRLRKEQMVETLECLLQMGSLPHIRSLNPSLLG